MTSSVGSIRGQIRIDAKQALAEYAAVRSSNAKTRASLSAASASFTRAGVGALAAAAPIVYFFAKAVSAAADFQKKLDFFGAVTNATQADMDAVAKKAFEMSKTTVYSAGQMADAFVEFGKAGISTKDILNGVADATANLAQASDINVQDAANVIVSTMSTFNFAANQTGHIADVLAGAANASIIDISDLATSLKYAGGIAAATKVPFESVVTAISLLGNAGIKGSTAGTSLRQIMISLTSQTGKARTALKDLGIITKDNTNLFIDQAGHIKPLAEIFQILQDHTRKLTDAQRLAALKVIFNSRALSSANILLKDGAKGFEAMAKSIGKVSAADVARKRLDNLSGDITHLKNSIQTMLIQAGGPLQQMLRVWVKGFTGIVQIFGNLPKPVQKMILGFLLLVATFLVVFGGIALLLGGILKIVSVFKDFFIALKLLKGGIGTIITAMRALGAAFIANPIVLVIVAVIALVAAFIYLWKHSAAFRNFWKKLWKDIQHIAEAVWHALVTAFHATINAIVGAAKTVWHSIDRWLVQPIVKAWQAVVHAFNAAKKWIGNALTGVVNFIKKHWTAIIAVIGLLLGPIGIVLAGIVLLVHKHWDAIVRFTKTAWEFIKGIIVSIWNVIVGIVKGAVSVVVAIFTFLWNTIVTIFTTIKNIVVAIWTTTFNIVKTVVTTAINAIVAIFRFLWNTGVSIFTAIKNFFVTIWQAMWSFIGPIVHAIAAVILAVFHAIIAPFKAIWNGLKNAVSSAAGAIFGLIKGFGKHILDFFANAGSWLVDAGKNLIKGLWKGISSLGGWLKDKVGGFIKNSVNNVLDFFGISSPSKLFAWIGKMLVHGLGRGIERNQAIATVAAKSMANEVTAASKLKTDYSLAARASNVTGSLRPSQLGLGKAAPIKVTVTAGAGAPGSHIGRKVDIENLNIIRPPDEPSMDSLFHTVQKITEDLY